MNNARPLFHRQPFACASKERRIARRIGGNAPVKIRYRGREEAASMVDVSLTGFRLRCRADAALPPGATIQVIGLGFEVRARQIWRDREYSGWRFAFNAGQAKQIEALVRTQNLASVMRVTAIIQGTNA